MNPEDKKKMGIIVLAVAAGLIAAVMTGNYIRSESVSRAKEYEQKRLMPLQKEIDSLKKQNQQIRQALQEQRQQPRMPEGMVPQAQQQQPEASLASLTPVGKRAVTVRINSLAAVGGLIHPGDYVDVLARLVVPRSGFEGQQGDSVTTIVFQNVQVLAVNSNVGTPGSYEQQQSANALIVTLAMDPQEASLMTFVQEHGALQMFLRPPAETETYEMEASDWQTLANYIREHQGVDIKPPAPKPAVDEAPEQRAPIQIFRGGQEL